MLKCAYFVFSAKPSAGLNQNRVLQPKNEEEEKTDTTDLDQIEEEEDPYKLVPEDIYDTVDLTSTYDPRILNRPPAPIPRPDIEPEAEKRMTYISQGSRFLHFLFFILFNIM